MPIRSRRLLPREFETAGLRQPFFQARLAHLRQHLLATAPTAGEVLVAGDLQEDGQSAPPPSGGRARSVVDRVGLGVAPAAPD